MPDDSIKTLIEIMEVHRPKESNTPKALFLRPKTDATIWFAKQAVGINSLSGWLSKICNILEIKGKRTHHAFRRRVATKLFQNGIDEQLIKEKTQHRSLGGVRQYKQISNEQRVALADTLMPKKKEELPCKIPKKVDEKVLSAETIQKPSVMYQNCTVQIFEAPAAFPFGFPSTPAIPPLYSLTPIQVERMEQNRKAALERLAASRKRALENASADSSKYQG